VVDKNCSCGAKVGSVCVRPQEERSLTRKIFAAKGYNRFVSRDTTLS